MVIIFKDIKEFSRKKILFIYYYDSDSQLNNKFLLKINENMKPYLSKFCDIGNIKDLEIIDIKKYNLVIIDSISLTLSNININLTELYAKLKYLKKSKNNALLLYDLHDYSLHGGNFKNFKIYNRYHEENTTKIKPNLTNNSAKEYYMNFFSEYNIKYLISVYDCPEFDYFHDNFRNIKKFFIINNSFCPKTFKPLSKNKIYDILIFGCTNKYVYPLRKRIHNICIDMNLKIKEIKYTQFNNSDNNNDNNNSQKELCKYINQSWLCISCVSNFSYFVRKYFEISACNSLVIGDTNDQGKKLGINVLEINMNMTDNEIKSKISHYLNNKHLITDMIKKNHMVINNYTYEQTVNKIEDICNSILLKMYSQYEYKNIKK